MKYIYYLFLITNLMACNDNIQSTTSQSFDSGKTTSSDTKEKPATDITGCYMKIVGRDTAILMLEQKGNEFTGKMLHDNYEKDGSRGIVKGKEDKEIIKLWYDFDSEGTHSVMEVYFKKADGRLLRGIGDMDAKTDTTYFISGINYSDKEAFTKVDCGLIEWKLKF
ncbi:MAG TPA: hypothetical protein VFU29_09685 [Chitinophagaceae bacterium]|nr:hypothetical protein [Chitinophagaceae bacterium]